MHWIDLAIIGVFILYAIGSGLRSSKVASKNIEEYFLAGRSLKGWQAGLSMAATQFAADTPLLVTGLIATAGIFALWRLWIYALAFLLIGFVLAGSWRRASVITDAELTELRYGGTSAAALRAIKALYFGTIFNCTVLAMVLLATTRIAEPFLHWDQWLPGAVYRPMLGLVTWIGVPVTIPIPDDPDVWIKSANNLISIGVIVLVTLFYSTTGGLRSVVATDIVQLILALVATAVFAVYVVYEAGGLSAMLDKLHARFAEGGPGGITTEQILAFTPSRARDAGLVVLAVFGMQWLFQLNADGTGYLAQRTMACRSAHDARVASLVLTFVQVFLRSLLWLPIALGLLVVFPPDASLLTDAITPEQRELLRAEREASYVRGVAELLPFGIKGLMLTGLLAALASTVDTHLNWGSSYWTNDIYKRFICQAWLKREPDPRTLVWVARGSNVAILLIALIIMSQLSSIRTAWELSLLLGAGLGVILVLRWLWWRINAWGEIACIVASLLLAPVLLFGVGGQRPVPAPDEPVVPPEIQVARADVNDPNPKADAKEDIQLEAAEDIQQPGLEAPQRVGGDEPRSEARRLLIMALLATVVGIVVSLALGPEREDRLREFYQRARPLGVWGPIARAEGDDPDANTRRLGWMLLAVAIAAFSIFSLLTGFGSWLCGSPPPVWFPWRGLWIALLLVIGIGLVPVWWWLGFSERSPSRPDRKPRLDDAASPGS